jgi:hypothetical protein
MTQYPTCAYLICLTKKRAPSLTSERRLVCGSWGVWRPWAIVATSPFSRLAMRTLPVVGNVATFYWVGKGGASLLSVG